MKDNTGRLHTHTHTQPSARTPLCTLTIFIHSFYCAPAMTSSSDSQTECAGQQGHKAAPTTADKLRHRGQGDSGGSGKNIDFISAGPNQ